MSELNLNKAPPGFRGRGLPVLRDPAVARLFLRASLTLCLFTLAALVCHLILVSASSS